MNLKKKQDILGHAAFQPVSWIYGHTAGCIVKQYGSVCSPGPDRKLALMVIESRLRIRTSDCYNISSRKFSMGDCEKDRKSHDYLFKATYPKKQGSGAGALTCTPFSVGNHSEPWLNYAHMIELNIHFLPAPCKTHGAVTKPHRKEDVESVWEQITCSAIIFTAVLDETAPEVWQQLIDIRRKKLHPIEAD